MTSTPVSQGRAWLETTLRHTHGPGDFRHPGSLTLGTGAY